MINYSFDLAQLCDEQSLSPARHSGARLDKALNQAMRGDDRTISADVRNSRGGLFRKTLVTLLVFDDVCGM